MGAVLATRDHPEQPVQGPCSELHPLRLLQLRRDRGLQIVTRNSDVVSNGEVAVIVVHEGRLMAALDRGDRVDLLNPLQLDAAQELHAMTIHKSQGSEFDTVSVILPPLGSALLTRELLYTAVTRARQQVRLFGSAEALASAVTTPTRRASGLGKR